MEGVKNGKQGGGLMKSKLILSFYRTGANQPSSAVVHTTAAAIKPRPVSVVNTKAVLGSSSGYIHGPCSGAGDEHVDHKASSYISHVKERQRLEELNLLNGQNCTADC